METKTGRFYFNKNLIFDELGVYNILMKQTYFFINVVIFTYTNARNTKFSGSEIVKKNRLAPFQKTLI